MQNLTAPEIVGLLLLALGALTGFFALMGVSSGYSNNPIVNVLVFIANLLLPSSAGNHGTGVDVNISRRVAPFRFWSWLAFEFVVATALSVLGFLLFHGAH